MMMDYVEYCPDCWGPIFLALIGCLVRLSMGADDDVKPKKKGLMTAG